MKYLSCRYKTEFHLLWFHDFFSNGTAYFVRRRNKSILDYDNAINVSMSTEQEPQQIYPSIPQGFAIIAIMIMATLIFSPLLMITNASPWKELLNLAYYLLSMGATLWFIRYLKIQLEGSAAFHFRSVPLAAFPLFVLAAMGVEIIVSPVIDLIPTPESMEEWFSESVRQRDLFTFLMMVIAAPVIEELIFRGVILEGFLRQFEPWQAILASSFLFGFAHLNPWQFITGLALGGLIGWVYYRTRSLTACMVIHGVSNLAGFGIRFFIDPEMATQSNVEFFGGAFNYLVIFGFALVVTGLCLWALDRVLDRGEIG